MQHAPITIAFVILALYTYKSGLRAPAMIAFVKDAMIYVFIVAAVVIVPYELGGFGNIFRAAEAAYAAKVAAKAVPAAGLTLSPGQIGPYITLAIGSAMALFMYPHALTGALAASSGRAIRQNTIDFTGLFIGPGFHSPARRDGARRGRQRGEPSGRRSAACAVGLPGLVRRVLLRCNRARSACPCRRHVDRGRQYVYPKRLETLV